MDKILRIVDLIIKPLKFRTPPTTASSNSNYGVSAYLIFLS
jgi:hypothetical protein